MKYIAKQSPPENFIRYKNRPYANFEDLSKNQIEVKRNLKETLLLEQGHICCYCGQEISIDSSIIEHLKSRSNYPKLQLDYDNLVCSCMGGKDRRAKNPQYPLYCDAHKGNEDIYIYPIECLCESKFEFDEDGNIYGSDDNSRITIDILNLNNEKLRNKRKNAIDAYRYYEDSEINWSDELEYVANRVDDSKYLPFCFVLHSYIRRYRLLA